MGQLLDRAQPWPEHGRPEDIAAAALFLASDDARFVTGEALVVDGGMTAVGGNMHARPGRRRDGDRRWSASIAASTGEPATIRSID